MTNAPPVTTDELAAWVEQRFGGIWDYFFDSPGAIKETPIDADEGEG